MQNDTLKDLDCMNPDTEYKIEFSLTFFRQGLSWATMNWIVSWGKNGPPHDPEHNEEQDVN